MWSLLEFARGLLEPDEPRPRCRKRQRWREFEIEPPEPDEEHADHETFWTAAPGIWYCRDCGEWYRTWRLVPRDHPSQRRARRRARSARDPES